MQFKTLSVGAVALAATGAQARMSAQELVNSLETIKGISNELIEISQAIDANTLVEMLPEVDTELSALIRESMETVAGLDTVKLKPEPLTEEEQGFVCDAVKNVGGTAQDLVSSILVWSEGTSIPFARNIVEILKVAETVLDTIASALVELVPSCGSDLRDELSSIEDELEQEAEKLEAEVESALEEPEVEASSLVEDGPETDAFISLGLAPEAEATQPVIDTTIDTENTDAVIDDDSIIS